MILKSISAKIQDLGQREVHNKEGFLYTIFDFSLQTRQQNLENKVQELEERLKILDNLPSNQFIIDQARQKNDTTQDDPFNQNVLSGMWQFMKFNRRLQATEEAIDRVMTILNEFLGSDGKIISGVRSEVDNIASELKNLKESLHSQQTGDNSIEQSSLQGSIDDSDGSQLQQQVNFLEKQLQERFVTKDDLSVYVKWPALEEALNVKKTDLEQRHGEEYKEDSGVLFEKTSHDHANSENKASDTESDGRPQTAPLPSTMQTPVPTPTIPKTAFASSSQVGSHFILFYNTESSKVFFE